MAETATTSKSPHPQKEPEFDIQIKLAKAVSLFLYSQLFVTTPYPAESFAGKTVIVTGANTGLGLEAARHFYRLGCARLILAVRTVAKGEAAKEDILRTVPARTDGASAVAVWPLDLGSTPSTLAFAARVRAELPRVDVLVENAGVNPRQWVLLEGCESAVQVNVLNTFLLALDLLPKLDETAARFPGASPRLVVVSSEAHHLTALREINAPDLYERLNDKQHWNVGERYAITKLLEVLFVREIVARRPRDPSVVINLVNPGLCKSELERDAGESGLAMRLMRSIIDRTTEVDGRALVLGASGPGDIHGEFMSDGKQQVVEGWIYQDVGRRAQRKVFEQTVAILEQRKPGVAAAAGF